MIKIIAEKSELTVIQNEQLTSGAMNAYFIQFTLSNDWDELARIVCFRIKGDIPENTEECVVTTTEIPLEPDLIVSIPYSMTAYSDVTVYVGLYGIDPDTKDIILPTSWVKLGEVKKGVLPSDVVIIPPDTLDPPCELDPDEGEEPTPPITGEVTTEQIETVVKNYMKKNPVQYNTVVGVPEPISNKQLEAILK